jgi:hypothetical protein
MRHIIGMTGYARTGKDTAAARLVEEHGFTRVAFADALREAALALDPIVVADDRRDIHGHVLDFRVMRLGEIVNTVGWETAKAIPEVRRTLQRYGVAIREIQPDFWINVAMRQADKVSGSVVVTDVRFPNEVEAVRRRGGFTIRMHRAGKTGDGHISEHALDGVCPDVTICNDYDLDTLNAQVDAVVRRADSYSYRYRSHTYAPVARHPEKEYLV